MTVDVQSAQISKRPIQWTAILQLVFSMLGALSLFAIAAIYFISGFSYYFSQGKNPADLVQPSMVAGSLIFAGALLLPSAWYAWKYLSAPDVVRATKPESRFYGLVLTIVVFVVTGLALVAGYFIAENDQVAWFLLPFLNIIATGLPAWWIIYFGTRGLLPNSPRHKWGVFASGLVLGPAIILVFELVLLIGVFIAAALWLTQTNPSLSSQLPGLINHLRTYGTDTQAILNSLLPYILSPVVIFLGFSFISVLVPIIEETFKPIGAWFMAGNRPTPAMGFAFGVLSGAGFGLFENLGNTSGAGPDWAVLTLSRISTLLLHSFTAGLVGWGLASAWTQRRFLRLAVCFLIAVLIHGTWNGMAIVSSLGALHSAAPTQIPAFLTVLGGFASLGIIALGVVVVLAFFGFNTYLRRSIRSYSPLTGSTPGTTPRNGPADPLLPTEPAIYSIDDTTPGQDQPEESQRSTETDLPHLDSGGTL